MRLVRAREMKCTNDTSNYKHERDVVFSDFATAAINRESICVASDTAR